MSFLDIYRKIVGYLPEVSQPKKKLSLKAKLYWTLGILVLYYVLAEIPLYGIAKEQATYFQTLQLLLGARFGTLLTLGIGPIVTASIVLQLLVGANLLKFDMTTDKGKADYTATYKLFSFLMILFESYIYVKMGAISPKVPSMFWIVFVQLALGGFIVLYMDEVIKEWGVGSGISLFIAAGIAQSLFIQLLSPFTSDRILAFPFGGSDAPIGKIWLFLYYLQSGNMKSLLLTVIMPILTTTLLFLLIVYFQSITVDLPLSFGRVRGQTVKWPLNFFYTSNIPVILVAALGANFQLWARLLQNVAKNSQSGILVYTSKHILGQLSSNNIPISGLVYWIQHINLFQNLNNLAFATPHILTYTLFMTLGSLLFSVFWVQSAGLDPKSQAKNIIKSGLQIPGFRKDERTIRLVLEKYIYPLTIMGGIAVGLLASFADFLGALTRGTGLLLLIMIVYQFYQILAKESMDDFALLRSFIKK